LIQNVKKSAMDEPFLTLLPLPPASSGLRPCGGFRHPHCGFGIFRGARRVTLPANTLSRAFSGRPLPSASSGCALRWLPAPPLWVRNFPGGTPRYITRKHALACLYRAPPGSSLVDSEVISARKHPRAGIVGRTPGSKNWIIQSQIGIVI
jgi:hypothetical protein